DDAEQLMVRPADPLDGATPSGASGIAEALQLAAHLAPNPDRYAAAGDATLASAAPLLAPLPRSGGHWLPGAAAAAGGARQIRGGGARADPDRGGVRPGSVGIALRCKGIGARRCDRRRRPDEFVGAAARPRPGQRGRRRLRLPWPRVRSAGDHYRRIDRGAEV